MKRNGEKFKHELIEEAVVEKTFDMDKDDKGYPTIRWLIGEYLLRDYSDFDRNSRLYGPKGYASWVGDNLHNALKHLLMNGTKVYVIKNGRTIRCITTNKEYRKSESEDYERICRNVEKINKAAIREMKKKHPQKLLSFAKRTQKLLPSSIEEIS